VGRADGATVRIASGVYVEYIRAGGTERIRSHVSAMNEREQMSGYRFVEMSGGLGGPEAAPDGKGCEHAAARLILDLRAQASWRSEMPREAAPSLHIRQSLEYGAVRHSILDRIGEILGRLRWCDAGGTRDDGLPIWPEEDRLVIGDGQFKADDMAFELALQFLNEVLGVVGESPIPKKLNHGVWFGVDWENVVGQSAVVGGAQNVDIPGL